MTFDFQLLFINFN